MSDPEAAVSQAVEPIRVGINGFGRIGRNFFRANMAQGNPLEIVAVNDLTNTQQLADLLKYDSVYGKLDLDVMPEDGALTVDEKRLTVLSERRPVDLPWHDLGVDVVIESTGRFTSSSLVEGHFMRGARKVIVSAPASGDDVATVVMGINEGSYNPNVHNVLSNASCTTNCLAPLASVLHEAFGIESGLMTTTHAYTADQNLQDGPHPDDRRRARAAALNIVPTSSGAAKAIGLVLPELAGKLHGAALRVPVPVGSLTELTAVVSGNPKVDEIHAAYAEASDGRLRGVLEYSDDPLVSGDIVRNPHSSIYDAGLTMVMGDQVRVAAWYDNEWGFSNRLVELTKYVGDRLVD